VNIALRLALFWLVCAAAALVYGQTRDLPLAVVTRALPAFTLEATLFFFGLGSERTRKWLERLPKVAALLVLAAAAAAPYCLAAFSFGGFRWSATAWIAAFSATAALWYMVLPERPFTDICFLAFLATVVLTRVLRAQYPEVPRLPLEFLGQAMWIRTAALVLLCVRRVQGVGFGFWPQGEHWRVGGLHFLACLPVAAAAAWTLGFATPHLPSAGWQRTTVLALGTFFGILWIVALGEEFLFRGLLQPWLGKWLGNEWAGLFSASLLFGSVHLWYRAFPNWQFAVLAGIAGVFYGLAFRQAGSIRASMVTHALTVTTWRVFFS
jgi:membrane protease YdiL (CAAX protease family)